MGIPAVLMKSVQNSLSALTYLQRVLVCCGLQRASRETLRRILMLSEGDGEKSKSGLSPFLSLLARLGKHSYRKHCSSVSRHEFPPLHSSPGARQLRMSCQAVWMLLPNCVLLDAGNLDFHCSILMGDVSHISCWREDTYCSIPNLLFLSTSFRFQY